jgi:signal peptidase I
MKPVARWIRAGMLLAVLATLAVFTRGFTALPNTYYMTGPSMAPGVGQGAWFLARPLTGPPARGQLVLWEHRLDDSLFHVLRRAVGLPGDTLTMRAGTLFVNGAPAPWPWRVVEPRAERPLDGRITGTIYNWGPVIVGADSVFLLSDTRDMFGWPDSRFVGPESRERIVARYLFSLRRGDRAP